ncbi:MAG TPA: anthranilate phosphoribosyltransferase [Opitutaceae bacterium]|jgi:anthranilate phosphoribosyltransferase|nr:anthranilate phosphoribosyltransferase [Opitutaceae bacterium]
MGDLERLTGSLAAGRELGSEEILVAAAALGADGPSDEEKAAFLSALSRKGETAAEVAGFATAYRALALDPGLGAHSEAAIDIVGTGGDHSGGFNVSTLVTLVVASAGVPVMKHGNRGITSKCGSADLFAAFGFGLESTPERLQAAMGELGYVFLFAPAWHPAFKRIGPVRKLLAARGERSVFNILGPLLNPGRPAHILLGAASPALLEKLADALEILGTRAGLAVHGVIEPGKGIDELTSATVNRARGVGSLRAATVEWTPESFGLVRSPFSEITGGDVNANLAIATALASGNGPGGLADTVVLNSAVALWVAGARRDPKEAIGEARELLLGGAVKAKMSQTRDFFSSRG